MRMRNFLGHCAPFLAILLGVTNYVVARDLFPVHEDGKWGYIDTSGAVAIPCQFGDAGQFSEGLASVRIANDSLSLIGFIDSTGRLVVEPAFGPGIYGMPTFKEGLAAVSQPGTEMYGYIDRTGKLALPYKYHFAGDFSEGLAEVGRDTTVWHGCINKAGKMVVPARFTMISEFADGVAFAVVDTSYHTKALIDHSGKYILGPTKEFLGMPSEGVVMLATQQSTGDFTLSYITFTGGVPALGPFAADLEKIDDMRFSEGRAALPTWSEDGGFRYGFLNRQGDTVVEPTFDGVGSFSEGRAMVEIDSAEDSYYGYIDTTGKIVVPTVVDGFKIVTPGTFKHGLVWVTMQDAESRPYNAYINRQGRIVWKAAAQ